jgi:creatinine amidohydrolase
MKMNKRIREWKYLTGTDFQRLNKEQCVVVVSCSPLEVHGPHLPVVTDMLEAEALVVRSVEMLMERYPTMECLRLPPLYVAADVLPHSGSIQFRSSTITRVLSDLGRSLAKQGFRKVWVTSFHGGPRHFVPIEIACDKVNRTYGIEMVSVFSLLLGLLTGGSSELAEILGKDADIDVEQWRGDSHGGGIETSMMLHLVGEYVDACWQELPKRTVNIKLKEEGKKPLQEKGRPGMVELIRGFREKLKYYETETYAGIPKLASPELGEQFIETLAKLSAEVLEDVWLGKIKPEQCHSPLWPVRWLFANEVLGRVFERAMSYKNRVFLASIIMGISETNQSEDENYLVPLENAKVEGLRQRQKQKTRDALCAAARKLFKERDFESVRIEEIVEKAEVSRRTFFRYFATKEAVVFPNHEQRLEDFVHALRVQPGESNPWQAVQRACKLMAEEFSQNHVEMLEQYELIIRTPSLIVYELELDRHWEHAMEMCLLENSKNDRRQRPAKVMAGALMGAVRATLRDWYSNQCTEDLLGLANSTIAMLEQGFGNWQLTMVQFEEKEENAP